MTQILDPTPIASKMPLDEQMGHEESETHDSERGTAANDAVSTNKDSSEPPSELNSLVSNKLKRCILGDAGMFPSYRNCMPIIFWNTWEKRRSIPFGKVEDAVHNTFVVSPERWVVHEQLEAVTDPCDDIVLLGNVWLPSGEREDFIDLQKKSFNWNLSFVKNFYPLSPSIPFDDPFTDEDDIEDGDASDDDVKDHNELPCSFDGFPIDANICEIRSESSACDLSPTLGTSSHPTRPSTLHNLFILFVCLFPFVFAIVKFLPLYDRAVFTPCLTHSHFRYYNGLRPT